MHKSMPPLRKGCFIKRNNRFIVDMVLDKSEKKQAISTCLLSMPQVDVLGTNILMSERDKTFKIPYIMELAEVDGGHIVCVNMNRALHFLINEMIKKANFDFHDLSLEKALQLPPTITANDLKLDLISKNFQPHLLLIHPIFSSDTSGVSLFPQEKLTWVFDHLIDAISYRRGGQQASMIFYSLHAGTTTIKMENPSNDYSKFLNEAIKSGVKIYCAKLKINEKNEFSIDFSDIFQNQL